ncbi:MAG TPA: DinB family protein [Gemmatimonadaceae bacterium]|nr:DinB family protein [Gemmatimonadaceae bacterium]
MAVALALLNELEEEFAITERILERVPQDRLAWAPAEGMPTLGQLAMHLALVPTFAAAALQDEAELDFTAPQPESSGEILATFRESVTAARSALRRLMDDAAMMHVMRFHSEGALLYELSRQMFLRLVLCNHSYHHRGQLTVYLRLCGVATPAIYGPPADEGLR